MGSVPSAFGSDNDGTRNIKPPASTPDAFNEDFCRYRNGTISNKHFRKTVDDWSPHSLNELISLMKDYCVHKYPIQKTWIVFYWISQNISYDAAAFFNKRRSWETPKDIFEKRTCVCVGYANLFSHLCSAIGHDVVTITGYSRGSSYSAEKEKIEPNHVWNAVLIKPFWYLVDSTWGSTFLHGKTFKKRLESHYFLTRPEHFIHTHFPENKIWQLLQSPVRESEFLAKPKTSPFFFTHHLKLTGTELTNTVHLKPNESYTDISIQSPSNVILHCSMTQHGQTVDNSSLTNYSHKDRVWHCLFAPQHSGCHTLMIFVREIHGKDHYYSALEISLDASKLLRPMKFPVFAGIFMENRCYLYEPLSLLLRRGSRVMIHCIIPKATRVAAVLDEKDWIYDNQFKDNTMKLSITVPEKSVTISAQFSHSGTKWAVLLTYNVE